MIEIKLTGGMQEITSELYALTSQLAAGKHYQDLSQRTADMRAAHSQEPEASATAEPRPPAPDKKRMPKPRAEKTPDAAPLSAAPIVENVESDVFDNEVVQEEAPIEVAQPEAEPLPDTEDGIRALVTNVIETCGADTGKEVIKKFAPKLSLITKEQYPDFGRACYKALREKLA